MGWWLFLLVCGLLIPAVMLGIGVWFSKYPPKTINWVCGYRTSRSTKSQAAWDFAQRYMGQLWKKWGLVMLLASVLWMLPTAGWDEDRASWWSMWLMIIQVAVLLLSIWPVERELARRFDREGRPRLPEDPEGPKKQ